MTDQQLIKKLRWGWRFVEGQDISNRDLELAANRIAELVKERKAMAMRDAGYDVYAGLEAKLAKAVEALVQLERIVGDILGAHLQDSESRDKAIDLIKTTLVELEGGE
jgi:hypothetical protein